MVFHRCSKWQLSRWLQWVVLVVESGVFGVGLTSLNDHGAAGDGQWGGRCWWEGSSVGVAAHVCMDSSVLWVVNDATVGPNVLAL